MSKFEFYGREKEQKDLALFLDSEVAEFIYILGRRRIGKTSLIRKVLTDRKEKFLYFFCSSEVTEKQLIRSFVDEINRVLGDDMLVQCVPEQFATMGDLLRFLLDLSSKMRVVMVWDEFQALWSVNKAIYGDFQKHRDVRQDNADVKAFFLGSHYTLMKEIFTNKGNPLYGRATGSVYLKRFTLATQIHILENYNILNPQNLLLLYGVFFGIPKYMEVFFMRFKGEIEGSVLDVLMGADSFFLREAKILLFPEFGGAYNNNVAILSAIAMGKTKRNEIALYTDIDYNNLGHYLSKLESYYGLIEKRKPLTNKKTNSQTYHIKDYFLDFYFSFIVKYRSLIEIEHYDELRRLTELSLPSYLGKVFEGMTKEVLIDINKDTNQSTLPFTFSDIGTYRDKKGENEIDIVCVNNNSKEVLFIECKVNIKRLDNRTLEGLKHKVAHTGIYKGYKQYFGVASLDNVDMPDADVTLSIKKHIHHLQRDSHQ